MISSSIQFGNNGSKTRRFSASFKVGMTAETRGIVSALLGIPFTDASFTNVLIITQSLLDECSVVQRIALFEKGKIAPTAFPLPSGSHRQEFIHRSDNP